MEISTVLSEMTIDEKIGQLVLVYLTEENADDVCRGIENGEVGACILANSALAGNDDKNFSAGVARRAVKASLQSRSDVTGVFPRQIWG